jgi:epoxide hydrolase-like predicted phosphatase
MQPKAIIFDYGNVLEGPLNEEAFESDLADLARQCGLASGNDLWSHLYVCDAWEKAKRGQITRADYWKDRLEALGILDEQAGIILQRLYRHRGLRPEMHQLLRELHGRYRLAVLSNTSRSELASYLAERRGLAGLFDVVISSAEAGLAKPEPEIYVLVLKRLGVRSNEALFIDDLSRNTKVAEAMGVPSIIFTTPAALRDELEARGIL